MQRFRKQKSFEKVRILSELQVWEKQWTFLFDRRLRNAIGHHSIRHDLVSGLLVERQSEPIPYTRFIVQVLRLVQACLVTAHLLKYVHLVPQFEAEGDADL